MRFCKDHDIRLVPFSPVTVNDNVEVRFQCFNDTAAPDVAEVRVALDSPETIIFKDQCEVAAGAFALFTPQQKFEEGNHTLFVTVNGKTEEVPLVVAAERKAKLSGGFVMLGPPNDRTHCDPFRAEAKACTEADWERYMDEMKKIGMDFIIITVTVQRLTIASHDDRAHYQSRIYERSDITARDPIGAILRAAERNCQQVFIGLGHAYGGRLKTTPQIMEELFELYGHYSSFYGWYQSEEANFHYFCADEFAHQRTAAEARDRLSPVMPILTSPFFICEEDDSKTTVNEQLLDYFEQHKPAFDILMPQDMVGQRHLTVTRAAEVFRRLAASCNKGGIHLWANCEAFNFGDEFRLYPRFYDGGFFGPDGYAAQIQGVYQNVEKVGTFMLTGFFTPPDFTPCFGGEKAVEFYKNYVEFLKTHSADTP